MSGDGSFAKGFKVTLGVCVALFVLTLGSCMACSAYVYWSLQESIEGQAVESGAND